MLEGFDAAVLSGMQTLRTPFLDEAVPVVTHLGDMALIWLIAAAVLIAQPKRRRWGIAVVVAVAAVVVVGLMVMKPLIGRVRPYIAHGFSDLLIPPPSGYSFPSGHSMASFAAATVLCCIPEKGAGIRALKIGAVAAALLIAFSRVYLYVHYPTDILAGGLVGVGLGLAAVALTRPLSRRAA